MRSFSAALLVFFLFVIAEAGAFAIHRAGFEGLYDNATELPTFRFLELARQSIDIEIYEMGDPDFRAALRRALTRRIRVRVVKDPTPVGSSCRYFDPPGSADSAECLDQKRLVLEVRAAGGVFVPFNKQTLCGVPGQSCYQHGKMILIDGRYALLSTGNFNSTNFCNLRQNPDRCDRDYSYITADPEVVATLRAIFERDLLGKAYDVGALLRPSVRAKLTVSPLSLEPLLAFIRSARRSVLVQTQYLHEPMINQALADAARRGVRVWLNLASFCAFGKPSAGQVSRESPFFQLMDELGAVSRFFNSSMQVGGRLGYLHSKAIVVDERYAWVGSVNGSTTSVSLNREFGVFFRDPATVSRLIRMIGADLTHPQAETWQESLACAKDIPFPRNP